MRLTAVAIRALGLAVTALYGSFIVWLYAAQPRSVAELAGGVVAELGMYRIDESHFQEGLEFFRRGRFAEARSAFARSDTAQRDPTVQFYVAYAYYREGWGRLYSDNHLFQEGLAALDRARAASADGRVYVNDANLKLHSADELRAELERGLAAEWSDLNPLRVFRERQ